MREIYYLTKRNMLLFLRDKAAVFFSVLSMLIVLALMVIFLGSMNCENVVDALAEAGGARDTAADQKNVEYLIKMWTLAGILVTNAVTVTLTVMGTMVQDETRNKLVSFYAAPVRRIRLALGYILSSWLVGTGMCVLTLIAGEAYMGLSGFPLLSVSDGITLFMMIVLNTFVWAAFAYLLALFIHSESAWSGVLTIVGTLVGFVGAIYLPMSMLPKGVGNVLKHLPVLHGAAMMRVVCTKDAVETTFAGLPKIAGDTFREQMGVHIIMNGNVVSRQQQILFLTACGIIMIAAAALIGRKRRVTKV
ncbi:MAG: ABC transporter permease [Lachnospiraceae bacterium]|nr:ABC transporter permease [Lachnospiraceae bacterium]